MNKHTSGPWEIDYEGSGVMGHRALLKNESGDCVGYLYEANMNDEDLIVAAPDLLDALVALLEVSEELCGLELKEMVKAHEAIKKATGGKE